MGFFSKKPKTELEQILDDLRTVANNQRRQFNALRDDALGHARNVGEQVRERLDGYADDWRKTTQRTARHAGRQARVQMVESVRAADRYAHDEPWKTAAAACALGLVIGVLLSRR